MHHNFLLHLVYSFPPLFFMIETVMHSLLLLSPIYFTFLTKLSTKPEKNIAQWKLMNGKHNENHKEKNIKIIEREIRRIYTYPYIFPNITRFFQTFFIHFQLSAIYFTCCYMVNYFILCNSLLITAPVLLLL